MRLRPNFPAHKRNELKFKDTCYLSFLSHFRFQLYAEKQFPGNPEQQAVLIHQLQKEHYHQYMQQLHLQSQLQTKAEEENKMSQAHGECGQLTPGASSSCNNNVNINASNETDNVDLISAIGGLQLNTDLEQEQQQQVDMPQEVSAETGVQSEAYDEYVLIRPAKMWTRPDIKQFKTEVSAGDGDGVITIGHGDTVTVSKSL